VAGPGAGNAQSPSGWVSPTDQLSTRISGNNALPIWTATRTTPRDTVAGSTLISDGNFVTPADLSSSPTTLGNKEVAVQNLFYLNNAIHDELYTHGFNEAAGNFQKSNFGNGGLGNDAVNAERRTAAVRTTPTSPRRATGQRRACRCICGPALERTRSSSVG
jgi:hypothetical protein